MLLLIDSINHPRLKKERAASSILINNISALIKGKRCLDLISIDDVALSFN
jgi:hypothetical protein